LSKRFAPSFSPIITEPTFDDSFRICATLLIPPPPSCASPTVRSATVIVGVDRQRRLGLHEVLLHRARHR
jgi:hypothetical protein